MAITIDNKTYRNLEEQVLKNKEDIAKHYAVDRVIADWGIKVLGVVPAVEDIPVATYEYGDAFGLSSTSPMQYVVWTRANANVGEATDYWLNIGALSLVGPQGPQGIQGNPGPTGKRGSLWTATSGGPTVVGANFLNGDLWLNATNGDVYQYIADDQRWSLKGNIRGPQGVQGPTGPKGEQGIQGPVGPQGPKGETGSSFKIGGLLENVDNLPIPTESNRSIGYAIKNADGITYDLYVVVGTDNLQWVNMGRVEGVQGPQGPVGPQGPAGADIQVVYITGIPSTVTQGTLTQTQVNTLLAHPSNYIQFFNENFYPQDVETSEGYIVYSHVGSIGGETKIKTINLTIATGGWVLTETPISSRAIDIVSYLPTANEENFQKGKIYTQGDLLQYISKIALSEPNIIQVGSLIGRYNIGVAAVVNDIYLFGGQDRMTKTNKIYKFSTTSNELTQLSVTLPSAMAGIAAAAVGNDIYLFGGNTGSYSKIIYKFSTTSNELTQLSVTLPSAMDNIAAAAVGNDIYLFGGHGSNWYTSILKYSTTTNQITWEAASLNSGTDGIATAAVGNDIYLFGGRTGGSAFSDKIYKFSTETKVLTKLSVTLPSVMYGIAAAAVGNDIYLFGGGKSKSGLKKTIYKFSTITSELNLLTNTIPTAANLIGSGAVGTNVYLFGGESGDSELTTINKAEFGFTYQYKTIQAL